MHSDFARLALNRTPSRHLSTIVITNVLCYMNLHVHFGIKLYVQLALANRIGILLPFRRSVGNLLMGPLSVGDKYVPPCSHVLPRSARHLDRRLDLVLLVHPVVGVVAQVVGKLVLVLKKKKPVMHFFLPIRISQKICKVGTKRDIENYSNKKDVSRECQKINLAY